MPPMDAATGNEVSVRVHYDALIAEGNDPVLDPPMLKAYMDGWDGDELFDLLDLQRQHRVLEIGVGTGRLALRVLASGCCEFVGMDVSEDTLHRAAEHLKNYAQVHLMMGEFPKDMPDSLFDRIYSSLTFMHIQNKRAAVEAICALLAPGGRAVISLDKSRDAWLDMGVRRVRVFQDEPEEIQVLFVDCGCACEISEIERAWLVCAERRR